MAGRHFNSDATACIECKIENGLFINPSNNNRCEPCDNNCKTCENSKTNCLSCETSTPLYLKKKTGPNECVLCTNAGWYKDGLECKQCHSSCYKCDGALETDCTECGEHPTVATTLYMSVQTSPPAKTCVLCDQVGEIVNGRSCERCHNTCKYSSINYF